METGSARVVLATSNAVPDDPRIEVLLPMANAYERQASITNLEGRVQRQEGGAAPPAHARADWSIVAGLAQRLGTASASDLHTLRSAVAAEHPAVAASLTQEALVARV